MFNMNPAREKIGYIVRHGELNDMSVWDGWSDMGLSDDGRQQAEAVARWLSFEKIGRVVASDLPRTVETAQFIMDGCDIACPFLMTDPTLRPRLVAAFAGLEKTPERLAEFQKYIDNPDLQIPDGESGNQLNTRIQAVWTYLSTPYDAKPSVIVIHNSVIKSLLGIDSVKHAVAPGGLIAVFMTPDGCFDFEVVLGAVVPETGVSG